MQEDAELHYGLGQVYALMGEREKAVESYERALELSMNEANRYREFARRISSREDKILLRLGLLYGETGDHAQAMEYYEAALFENPLSADAEYNLAVSLCNLDRTDEAIKHCQKLMLNGKTVWGDDSCAEKAYDLHADLSARKAHAERIQSLTPIQ